MDAARHLLLPLVIAAALGCQTPRVRVVLTEEAALEAGLEPSGAMAVDSDGRLILVAGQNVYRGDPAENAYRPLLAEQVPGLGEVTTLDDGTVLVTRGATILAPLSGYPIDVVALPHPASAISAHGEAVYVLTRDPGGVTRLLRHSTETRRSRAVLATRDPIQAICAVRGGCLVACNGKVLKVTDPEPAGDGTEEVVTALAFAVEGPIASLAADSDRRIVYVSDGATTLAWAEGRIVPLLPVGGRLAWGCDALAICRPGARQIVQVTNVSGILEQIQEQLRRPLPPSPPVAPGSGEQEPGRTLFVTAGGR